MGFWILGEERMKFNNRYFTLGDFSVAAGLLWFYYSEYQQKTKDYDGLNSKYQTQVITIKDQHERTFRNRYHPLTGTNQCQI
ncbi:phosphoprotein phosphatase [Xenorhabdus mauleonii]|uniref:Phosphoprotein phosphatase n=2 Tax=Xenorhabdus mauleonii TaxID=351675 RepID=A0A1I3HWP8_9GAMM|nr:hypothetical protein [Xenorhabdus mauleonii]PHM40248.1 phosphoprotein phosphatase [Xenorhabdus mauleonii]SFI40000.1 prophage endopeptidase [Xenorhabdus mauleonii]